MKYYLLSLSLLFGSIAFAQTGKVYYEGQIEKELNPNLALLEQRKKDWQAIQLDQEAAKKAVEAYFDHKNKALENLDENELDLAYAKLREAKELMGRAHTKFVAYYKKQGREDMIKIREWEFTDAIESYERALSPDAIEFDRAMLKPITEIYLVPPENKVVTVDLEKEAFEKNFWILGDGIKALSGRFEINGRNIDLKKYNYSIYAYASFSRYGDKVYESPMYISLTRPNNNIEQLLYYFDKNYKTIEKRCEEGRYINGLGAKMDHKVSYKECASDISIEWDLKDAIDQMLNVHATYKGRGYRRVEWVLQNAHTYPCYELTVGTLDYENWYVIKDKKGYVNQWTWGSDGLRNKEELSDEKINENIQKFALELRQEHYFNGDHTKVSLDQKDNLELSKLISEVFAFILNDERAKPFADYYVSYYNPDEDKTVCNECIRKYFALALTYRLFIDIYNS
jgi:hypothetical protein